MSHSPESLVDTEVDLKSYNTLGISARASFFAAVHQESEIKNILADDRLKDKEIMVIGGGSNILFADDFDGLILHVEIKGREVIRETDEHIWLKIGAGENWHETVRYCVEKGWGGIENLSLIPGTVGAAPIQNIGAYGVELDDVFEKLEAIDIKTAKKLEFEKKECKFGYRDSIFKNELKGKVIVSRVVLKLSKNPVLNLSYGAIQKMLDEKRISEPSIKDVSDVVMAIRNSKLPNPDTLGNAGSFFKNPIVDKEIFERIKEEYPSVPGYPSNEGSVKIPAGWLIEQAGWKGKKIGNTGTYKQQALVIVNYGNATGEEIISLATRIQESVAKKFGIELTPEVNIIK